MTRAIVCQPNLTRSLAAICVAVAVLGACENDRNDSGVANPDGGANLPACSWSPQAPLGPSGFTVSPETLGSDGAAGAGGAPNSGCVTTTTQSSALHCEGLADVAQSDAGGPVLTLADGSMLAWQPGAMDPGALVHLSHVQVEYADEKVEICPFCGTFPRRHLLITDPGNPQRRLFYSASSTQDSPYHDISTVLEAPVRQEPICAEPSAADCYVDVETRYYDYVVEPPPEQRVQYGVVTNVSTPAGDFSVFIAEHAQTGTLIPSCADGRGLSYGGNTTLILK
jgi:hypothetical protein